MKGLALRSMVSVSEPAGAPRVTEQTPAARGRREGDRPLWVPESCNPFPQAEASRRGGPHLCQDTTSKHLCLHSIIHAFLCRPIGFPGTWWEAGALAVGGGGLGLRSRFSTGTV